MLLSGVKGRILLLLLSLVFMAGADTDEDSHPALTSVDTLLSVAEKYRHTGNTAAADSIYQMAIDAAALSGEDAVAVQVYLHYFSDEDVCYTSIATEHATQLLAIARRNNNDEWLYHAHAALAHTTLAGNEYKPALDYAAKAYYYINQTSNAHLKTEALLLYGTCLENNNRKIEAFRNYMDALYSAEKLQDEELTFECNGKLSLFYKLINKYDRAKAYKLRQLLHVNSHEPVDSSQLMTLKIDLSTILFLNGETRVAERMLDRVMSYSIRSKDEYLKDAAFSVYRSTYITNGQFDKIAELYLEKYPQELARTQRYDTTLFFRLKAFIYEAQGRVDSAREFYHLAEQRIIQGAREPYFTANFYKRFGQFLLRNGSVAEAEEKLQTSLQYASQVEYLPYMIEVATLLDSVNTLQQDYGKAYEYAKLHNVYTQWLSSIAQEDELLRLEVDNETKKRELYELQQQAETKRRHNLQYMAITIGIIVSFIILAMLGYYEVRQWMIKAMGFFAFIFFFEFIILLADHQIHHATHGEPWKIMAIKIVLIGILLPLHHSLEEKVVHYLSYKGLRGASRFGLKLKKKPPIAETAAMKDDVKEQL